MQANQSISEPAKREAIVATGLTKWFGDGPTRMTAVNGVEFVAHFGEMLFIVGPSGSGKTTLLSMISGILRPNAGSVTVNQSDIWTLDNNHLAEFRLNTIGFVFQDFHLFPRLTSAENVAIPLILKQQDWNESITEARRCLEIVGLKERAEILPVKLSGGEQQRVAIARAIIYEPAVLLMDEPLGALDRRLRGEMQLEIKALHARLGVTVVYVTHDQDEALSMSDRVVVFNKGRIEQVGLPQTVYRHPATLFVADFLGDSLAISATVTGRRARLDGIGIEVALPGLAPPCGRVKLLWRSDRVAIGASPGPARCTGDTLVVPATVLASAYGGSAVRLRVRLATGDSGTVVVGEGDVPAAGTALGVVLDIAVAAVLPIGDDGTQLR